MSLSTLKPDGFPASRIVLLRGVGGDGLRFFTNYQSAKGRQLGTGKAAALFFWPALERQVRIEGVVSVLSANDSDAYFASRPRESQLGAWASPQSEEIASREELERRYAEVTAKFLGKEVTRPPFWGGYLLTPVRAEFWQDRKSRLHDRLVYLATSNNYLSATGTSFRIVRLGP
jgi:pyridoxamine 5'-phosphate oxidase